MAKRATKSESGAAKKVARKPRSSGGGRSKSGSSRSLSLQSSSSDPVDSLIRLLQSPLVIDLLAVGATAALAAITEQRSSRVQGAVGNSKKVLMAAGKAAAAAVARRLANEFDEIRSASLKAKESRRSKAGAAA